MIKKLLADKEGLKNTISKVGITFFLRMFGMALSFVSLWIMTNYFGKSVYGMYSLSLTILQLTGMFFGLGVPNAFVSFTGGFNSHEMSRGLLIKCIKLALLASLLPIVVFSAGAGIISTYIFEKPDLYPYLLVVALGVPFFILHEIICFYFIAVKRIVIYGLFIFILPHLFFITMAISLYYSGGSDYLTFLAFVAAYILTVTIGLIIIFGKRPKIELPHLTNSDIFRKSFPMMISGLFLVLLNWTDMLMLGRSVSADEIGIYNSAFRIGYLSLFFVAAMNVVILPSVSELYHQKDMVKMKKVVNRSTQLVILLTLPLALVLIFFGEFILSLLGKGLDGGSMTLTLITLGGLFNAMTGNVDQILNMTGNQKMVSILFFFGFVLNVILNLFLIPAYGIEGAATSSLITNIIVNTAFVIIIKKKLGFYTFI